MMLTIPINDGSDTPGIRLKFWSPERRLITGDQQKAHIEDCRPHACSFPINQDNFSCWGADRIGRVAVVVDNHSGHIFAKVDSVQCGQECFIASLKMAWHLCCNTGKLPQSPGNLCCWPILCQREYHRRKWLKRVEPPKHCPKRTQACR